MKCGATWEICWGGGGEELGEVLDMTKIKYTRFKFKKKKMLTTKLVLLCFLAHFFKYVRTIRHIAYGVSYNLRIHGMDFLANILSIFCLPKITSFILER